MGHDDEVLWQVLRLSCGPSSALRNVSRMESVDKVFVNTQYFLLSYLEKQSHSVTSCDLLATRTNTVRTLYSVNGGR